MTVKILVAGFSHVTCVALAAAELNDSNIIALGLTTDEALSFKDPAVRKSILDRAGQVDVLCMLLDGNFHNVLAVLNNPRLFYVLPAAPQGEFITEDMMVAHISASLSGIFQFEKDIIDIFPDAQRLLINPPPPVADAEYLLNNPTYFSSKISMGVSPDDLRVAIHALQSKVYMKHAEILGAKFVPCSSLAIDETGKLARQYRSDGTHGNKEYGKLVIAQIYASLGIEK